MEPLLAISAAALLASAAALPFIHARLLLSRAKHPSLAGHPRLSQRLAKLVPFYEYDDQRFFTSDGAPAEVSARRRSGFDRLARLFESRAPTTIRRSAALESSISDLNFTANYRVPFQYSRVVRRRLPVGSLVERSCGVRLTDLDGNAAYDLTGSYGVNLFGYDFAVSSLRRGARRFRLRAARRTRSCLSLTFGSA